MASRFFPLFNIDQPVGPGKTNKPDDVRLVQCLLIELSRYEKDTWVPQLPDESKPLMVATGVFDDALEDWIMTFQKFGAHSWGANVIKTDGIIDPMPQGSSADLNAQFQSGRISTLAMLCNRLWRYNQQTYLALGDRLKVPWVPEPKWSS